MCSPQIQSGWRPLFSALRTVHGNKPDMKDYLIGEYSMGMYDRQPSLWVCYISLFLCVIVFPKVLHGYSISIVFTYILFLWVVCNDGLWGRVSAGDPVCWHRASSPLFKEIPVYHCFFIELLFCSLCNAGKSQAPVFDVFEAFINTDNIQVFANAATDYIMCLMKFVKGLGKSGKWDDYTIYFFFCGCVILLSWS